MQNHSFFGHYSLAGELFLHSREVGRVGVGEICNTARNTGFVMNAIPHNLIIQSSRHTPSNCEYQFPIKGLFQKLEHLSSFRSIGKVRDSCSPTKMDPISLARLDFVGDCNGSFGMSWACRAIIFMDRHGSFWLVASHMPKNGGANRTLGPFFLPNQSNEAIFVVLMRAAKHEYIIIIFLSILLLNILDDILLQTDHTLLFLHFALPKGELDGRKV